MTVARTAPARIPVRTLTVIAYRARSYAERGPKRLWDSGTYTAARSRM